MKKISRYVSNIYSALRRPLKTRHRPIHIQLEPSTLCNLACAQCPRDYYVKKARNMALAKFMEVIDQIEPYYLTLNGLGEPTLNKEIFEMIRYAKSKSISINTTSNFVRITDEQIDLFLNSGLDLLNISVDAAAPETYIKTRSDDCYNDVITNIRRFMARKKELKADHLSVRLCFVIQKENLSEMVAFFHLAKELGIDAILYQIFESYVESKKYLINGIDPEQISAGLDQLIQLESQGQTPKTNASHLKQKIADVTKLYSNEKLSHYKKCVLPWVSLYTSVEGDIRPCCRFSAKRTNMGNIFETNIKDIYRSSTYRMFRKTLKSDHAPDDLCATCIPDSPFNVLEHAKWAPNFFV